MLRKKTELHPMPDERLLPLGRKEIRTHIIPNHPGVSGVNSALKSPDSYSGEPESIT